MRKFFTFALAAVALASTASGQLIKNWNQDLQPVTIMPEQSASAMNATTATTFRSAVGDFRIVSGDDALRAPLGEPLTMEQYIMNRSDTAFFISWGTSVGSGAFLNRVGDVIVCNDGAFYLKDLFFRQPVGTWLKGEVKDGAMNLTLPQTVAWAQFEDGSTKRLIAQVIEQDSNTFVPVANDTTVRFSWDGDSLKVLNPNTKIGLCVENGGWTGYAEWGMNWNVQRDVPSKYIGNADPMPYGMNAFAYNFIYNQTLAFGVRIRRDGDKIILSDIPATPAGSVIIGSVDGNTVTIPQQYLGIDSVNRCHVYFQPLNQHLTLDGNNLYVDDKCADTYTLSFDADSMTYHAATDNAYSINCGKNVIMAIDQRANIHNARFKPFDGNKPATPANGAVYMFSNSNPTWGFACFAHSMMSTEAEYLDPDQLYWSVYFNDTIQALDTSVYTGFDTDEATVTEIPWNFANAANIFAFNWNYMHQISTFSGWTKLGIQLIYKAGGEVRKSNIFNSDQTITDAGAVTAISDDFDHGEVREVIYYDIAGRRVANPERGIYIRTQRYTDGTTKTTKVML